MGTLPQTAAADELSLPEWYELPANEPGELVDGHLQKEEVPDFIHELLVMLLGRVLGNWVLPEGGFVAGSEVKFAVTAKRGRKSDLSVYLPGRRPPARGLVRIPPDIIAEIVSPRPRDSHRDRVEKMVDYAAFGVPYYWILDPQLRSLEIFGLGANGRYSQVLAATGGVLTRIPGCAGLELDLDALWAAVDRLEA